MGTPSTTVFNTGMMDGYCTCSHYPCYHDGHDGRFIGDFQLTRLEDAPFQTMLWYG